MLITAAIAPGFTDEVQQAIQAFDFLSQVNRETPRDTAVV